MPALWRHLYRQPGICFGEKNNKDDVAHYKKYGKLYKMNDLTTNPVVGMFKMFFAFFVFYAIAYIIALPYIMYRGA